MPKASTIQDVAAAIRNWRRHFDRGEEVAVLPDGILCLKALDEPLQKIACLDQQAAFRLSQSRPQLQLDERPDHRSLWSFSQCLLAEAEMLSLLQTAPSPGDKAKFGCTADKPCKYFISDTGCKAGKRYKWLHSWDGVDDVGFVGARTTEKMSVSSKPLARSRVSQMLAQGEDVAKELQLEAKRVQRL